VDVSNKGVRRNALIARCDIHGDLIQLDDGYLYYWVKDKGGLSSSDLRIIAEELDECNKDWDKKVKETLNASGHS